MRVQPGGTASTGRSISRRALSSLTRAGILFVVLVGLLALWEGYRWFWMETGWTRPFPVNSTTMPHIHEIVGALFDPINEGQPQLIDILFHAAVFTTKEAVVGFAIGATIGFVLGAVIARFAVLGRGVMPYVVASQTIPILAVAPIVVVGLGSLTILGWTPTDWMRVAVIAAYLTFFPVTVNTVRGLQSADPAAVELMESYAAGEWAVFWKLRVPSALPFLFSAFRIAATACVIGAIIGELPTSIQDGLGGAIINFNQYYVLNPTNLWATNVIAALLGIGLFLVAVIVRGDWIKDKANQATAVKFLEASFKGWIYCRDHVKECTNIVLANGTALPRGHQTWQMNEVNALVWPNKLGIGVMDPAEYKKTATIAKTYKVIKKPAPKASYRTDLALKAVANLKKQGLDVNGNGYKKAVVKLTAGGK